MIGPARPQTQAAQSQPSASAAGPTLPPHLQHGRSGANDEEDDDEDDDYTPSLPPGMTARTAQGPTLPAHLAKRNRSPSPASEEDSDDDSDVGPLPAPNIASGSTLSAAEEFRLLERQKQEAEEEQQRLAGQKPKREAWMTVPPSALDALAHRDPTKITKTGFSQNSRRGAGAEKATEDGRSLWTETPQERAKRLEEEVSGKRKRLENATKQETDQERTQRRAKEARDAEMRAQTAAFNSAAKRSDTLVTVHQKKTAEEEEEQKSRKKAKSKHRRASRSPSPTAPAFWDREKMMGMGGRLMDEGKRREIIGDSSANLGSKFGSGSYL